MIISLIMNNTLNNNVSFMVSQNVATSYDKLTNPYQLTHASLMIAAYVIFTRIAIYSARFNQDKVFKDEQTWLKVHVVSNILSILCVIPGVVIAFNNAGWVFLVRVTFEASFTEQFQSFRDSILKQHSLFGIISVSLLALNFLLGLIRAHIYIRPFHFLIGFMSTILADYVTILGLLLFRNKKWSWLPIFYCCFLLIDFVIALCVRRIFKEFMQVRSKVTFIIYCVLVIVVAMFLIVGMVL